MTPRPSLRWRLTALYGALFFVAGGVLLAVNYTQVRHSLPSDKIIFSSRSDGPVDSIGGDSRSAPVPPEFGRKPDRGGTAAFGIFVNGEATSPDQLAKLPGEFRDETLSNLVARSLVGLVGVGAASVVLGWWLAGRALRPLHRITDTARRLSETNLDERIGLDGPHDELRELADTFDAMLGRLDAAVDSQRRFVANASHELKTPLAINRTLLEVALDSPDASADLRRLGGTLLEVNARQERLIDSLLMLARSAQTVDPVPVDLAEVARRVVDSARPEARDAAVDISVHLAATPTLGDPVLLERLIQNLMQNAVRYNAPGGWIRLTCHCVDDRAVLTVANTGLTVAHDEVAGLFEPFRRLDDRVGSAEGSGLGLSIVRSVARAHGGEATALPRPGGGLVVTVALPAG
jgi:signal transduction histidine kinase